MRQVLQYLNSGETVLIEAPVPMADDGRVVVQTQASVISVGTEGMLVDFGRAGLVRKASSQPDKVRQAIDKARTEGLSTALGAVLSRMAQPIPLGYSNAGIVTEVGTGVSDLRAGDRVVTNGPHAEYVAVPARLIAKVPASVPFELAAFTPIASVALQGIRVATPSLGETIVVFGLGLIGLLSVQLLRASGCQVLGIDPDQDRRELAESLGARTFDPKCGDIVTRVATAAGNGGADVVLLTLTSRSSDPALQAARMARKRGRLVLVGVTGLNLQREELYRKELSLSVSCSYGPGRYDPEYEERGHDYPLPYVRWTEQRNFSAVLQLMADRSVDPGPLITHRIAFENAPKAYDIIRSDEHCLGIVLEYVAESSRTGEAPARLLEGPRRSRSSRGEVSVAVIGAGNYASRVLLPKLKSSEVRLRTIVSQTGTAAAVAGRRFGFERVSSDVRHVFDDSMVDLVFIATRHDSHADLTRLSLLAGKHVFVEKPLALTTEDLESVRTALADSHSLLVVGYNRRFSPLCGRLKKALQSRSGPAGVIATVNAGFLASDHWLQDQKIGGGRIIGEACHLIDVVRCLVDSPIADLQVVSGRDRHEAVIQDVSTISIRFKDGSVASIQYFANGSSKFPKERVEVFWDGRVARIDNWRKLSFFGGRERTGGPRRMDKGHAHLLKAWLEAVKGEADTPIPFDEMFEVSRWAIRAADLARL